MSEYLKDLNESQREAVVNIDGPSLVIAGAGSGKTRVLTYRIAQMLEQGVPARSILALTFTNKAAKEMKERIAKLVGHDASRNIWMGTFHSIFSRILRIESEALGYPSNFSIYDTSDSKSVIKAVMKELQLDDQIYKVNEMVSRISMSKNNLITPAAYLANTYLVDQDKAARKPRIVDIYRLYCIRCKKSGAMDFDDLLLYTNLLFRDFPDILEKYRRIFQYILVDEYQDTNFSQYLIVNKLSNVHRNLCVVGDDAQSIYSFRGARIENILNFKNDYTDYKLFKLEQNYRSTQNIVNAANSLISRNKDQIQKRVFSENEVGEKIKILGAASDHEEGFLVANSIYDIHLSQQALFSQFAVLYRTNAQSRIFEDTLRRKNIPYKVYGSLSFYQRKEIKDLLAYMRLALNTSDDEAFKRIVNYPARGIGDTTMEKIESFANSQNQSIWTLADSPMLALTGVNKGTMSKVEGFVQLIKGFSQKLVTTDAFDLAMHIANVSGIIKDIKTENTIESQSRFENIQELLNSIKEFSEENKNGNQIVTLDRYMENVSLLTDTDTEDKENRDKVSLMTIHASKGLEFDYVFVGGMEEELFPSQMTANTPDGLEEERRLFYVAITRAGKQVYLSYAGHRYKWGQPTVCTPSRFLKDIDPRYFDEPIEIEEPVKYEEYDYNEIKKKPERAERTYERKPAKPTPTQTVSPTFFNRKMVDMKTANRQRATQTDDFEASDPALIHEGSEVYHQQFGMGKVTNLDGNMPNTKATVFFESAGEKKLLLKFARLKLAQ